MHVNYVRGETRRFVFRREHGYSSGFASYYNSKRGSLKPWKRWFNRRHRKQDRAILRNDPGELVNPHSNAAAGRRGREERNWGQG